MSAVSDPEASLGQKASSKLQELMAMQENGPRNLGFFGTRNMGFMHQNLIEVLSYAMVLTVSELLIAIPFSDYMSSSRL